MGEKMGGNTANNQTNGFSHGACAVSKEAQFKHPDEPNSLPSHSIEEKRHKKYRRKKGRNVRTLPTLQVPKAAEKDLGIRQ